MTMHPNNKKQKKEAELKPLFESKKYKRRGISGISDDEGNPYEKRDTDRAIKAAAAIHDLFWRDITGNQYKGEKHSEKNYRKDNRGYPRSGEYSQKEAAANNYSNSAANRGYPQSGDKYQKQAAQNSKSTRQVIKDAFKKKLKR